MSRFNVWVDFEGSTDAERALLSNTAVSTKVTVRNGVPVVVERALWWPGTPATWYEAHASAGSSQTSTRWLLADGESGDTRKVGRTSWWPTRRPTRDSFA